MSREDPGKKGEDEKKVVQSNRFHASRQVINGKDGARGKKGVAGFLDAPRISSQEVDGSRD